MKSNYVVPGVPAHLHRDCGNISLIAASGINLDPRVVRAKKQFMQGRTPYNPKTQPRDPTGRFRKILARLRVNLGDTELQNVVDEIKKAERAEDVGDYEKATQAGQNVVKMIDDVQDGVLDKGVTQNLRRGAADLGRVLAYLPLPQGSDTAKVKFSDLPPSTGRLIHGLIDRVVEQLGQDKASKYIQVLNSFISGVRMMTSDQLSTELNRLLRVLA